MSDFWARSQMDSRRHHRLVRRQLHLFKGRCQDSQQTATADVTFRRRTKSVAKSPDDMSRLIDVNPLDHALAFFSAWAFS